jgi:hypothetical protein
MTQINAHVESEGLQLESLLRKRNLEKKGGVVFGTPVVRSARRSPKSLLRMAHRSLVGRTKSPTWRLSPGKSQRARHGTECWIALSRTTP